MALALFCCGLAACTSTTAHTAKRAVSTGATVATTAPRPRPAVVDFVHDLTGPSPFAPGGCAGSLWGKTVLGTEYQPQLAVNPTDPRNLVAIWTQDHDVADITATSADGGRTWTAVSLPGGSACTGGTEVDAWDPDIAFDASGVVYASYPSNTAGADGLTDSLLVNRSTDGGRSWSKPITVERARPRPDDQIDFPILTSDPHRHGNAYLVWTEFNKDWTAREVFAMTTDAGLTWTRPTSLPAVRAPGRAPFASQIRVLPDGTVLDVLVETPIGPKPIGPTGIWVLRSSDRGRTWSKPIHVAEVPINFVTDPDTGRGLGGPVTFVTPSIAVGPSGTVYLVWHDITSASASKIVIVTSPDGGRTWSDPSIVADETAESFRPTVAVTPDGVVGVTYYDFRNDRSGDKQLTTDVWFRSSRDGGATWSEAHVGGPFDLHAALGYGGPLDGYPALTPIGRDALGSIFVQAIQPADHGATDLFFARIQIP